MKSPRNRPQPGFVVEVYAAACSGCARLSERIGLPVVLVDVAFNAEAAIGRLNRDQHASGVRFPNFFQPIYPERGWSDWGLFPIVVEDTVEARVAAAATEGVCFAKDRIIAVLPRGTTLAEFSDHLHGAIRHLSLQEVTARTSYMDKRSDALADYVVHPRYTPAPNGDFRGARAVSNLLALDPTDAQLRLYWLVVTARMAASDARRLKWRGN